jgi:hypothetical protein
VAAPVPTAAALVPTAAQRGQRTFIGLSLFTGQAFLYNAIFFTYALVLTEIYDVSSASVGWYLVPFAVGNLLGPLLLGRFFDTVGRKPMIAGMILGGIIQATMGVEAAQRDLEDIAPPLSAQAAELSEPGEEADPYTLGRDQARGARHADAESTSPGRPTGGDR